MAHEEDIVLQQLVERYGPGGWTALARHIPGRTGKQARERWLNQLSPWVRRLAWTPVEDAVLVEAHAKLGSRWSTIAKLLPGRVDNHVKNRWNTTIARQNRVPCPEEWSLEQAIAWAKWRASKSTASEEEVGRREGTGAVGGADPASGSAPQ
ncbi:hypothetical protein MMPV_002518 [Pyropia vietnamensis]